MNNAWGVEKQRSFLRHRMVSFFMLLAAGATLLLTVILFSAGEVVQTMWFAQVVERFPGLQTLAGLGVRYAATLMLIIGVGLVFYFIPNAKVRFRDVWVGAVITGLLWRAAYAGFAWYVRDFSRFSIHGSIGAVVAFMLWIYISSVILLYRVEFRRRTDGCGGGGRNRYRPRLRHACRPGARRRNAQCTMHQPRGDATIRRTHLSLG